MVHIGPRHAGQLAGLVEDGGATEGHEAIEIAGIAAREHEFLRETGRVVGEGPPDQRDGGERRIARVVERGLHIGEHAGIIAREGKGRALRELHVKWFDEFGIVPAPLGARQFQLKGLRDRGSQGRGEAAEAQQATEGQGDHRRDACCGPIHENILSGYQNGVKVTVPFKVIGAS